MESNKSIFLLIFTALAITGSVNAGHQDKPQQIMRTVKLISLTQEIEGISYTIESLEISCKVDEKESGKAIFKVTGGNLNFEIHYDRNPCPNDIISDIESVIKGKKVDRDVIFIDRMGYMRKLYNFFTSRYFIIPAILYCLHKLSQTS